MVNRTTCYIQQSCEKLGYVAQYNPRCCPCWPGSDISEGPNSGEFCPTLTNILFGLKGVLAPFHMRGSTFSTRETSQKVEVLEVVEMENCSWPRWLYLRVLDLAQLSDVLKFNGELESNPYKSWGVTFPRMSFRIVPFSPLCCRASSQSRKKLIW